MSKESIQISLDKNWQELLESIEGLPDSMLLEPNAIGVWSVRDVLSHITTWEEEALGALPAILEKKPLPRYAQSGGIAAFNAREQEKKRHLGLRQIREELAISHKRLLAFLSDVPESNYVPGSRFLRRLREDTYHHYQEHAKQVTAWRKERGHDGNH